MLLFSPRKREVRKGKAFLIFFAPLATLRFNRLIQNQHFSLPLGGVRGGQNFVGVVKPRCGEHGTPPGLRPPSPFFCEK
jgi:hypothetical protein